MVLTENCEYKLEILIDKKDVTHSEINTSDLELKH